MARPHDYTEHYTTTQNITRRPQLGLGWINVIGPIGVITPNQIPLTTIVTYLQVKLQKQNFKPLGHYTCMQCGTSHLQTVQENILSRIILATYRKFTVATVRFTQNVSCNIFTHPIYQLCNNSLCNNSSDNKSY